MRLGAADYLVKPMSLKQLQGVLSRVTKPSALKAAAGDLESQLEEEGHFGALWGRSPPMRRVYDQIARVAGTAVTVFITGESGSGKEVVARTVHDLSRRRAGPFLAVNCGAISPHLIESEIFGHEKGSFTGADRQHLGFFERTNGGTLFLDEITEMPLDLQVKLLRVLETGTFMRVGSTQVQETDVRLDRRHQPQPAAGGGQRQAARGPDVPAERVPDPPAAAARAGRGHAADRPPLPRRRSASAKAQPSASRPDALQRLSEHRWPGNVRELRNVVYRAYVMTHRRRPSSTTACPASPALRRRAAGRRRSPSASARRWRRSSGS